MESYAWDAQDYEQSSSVQQKWARELAAKLGLNSDERILDIGSGDGKVTSEIAAMVHRGSVVGIDSSGDMISLAKTRYPQADWPNLGFRRLDARDLPFEGEFSVVFSSATLHWVIDHLPVLQDIRRGLRAGGKAFLQMGGEGNAADMVHVVEGLTRTEDWREYFTDFTFPYGFHGREQYLQWLSNVGLHPIRVELIPKDMSHERSGLESWMRTTWMPYTERVPETKRAEFIEQAVDRYLQRHPIGADGLTHLGMVRLEVEAAKPS